MRLHPAVTEAEALDWLRARAVETWGKERAGAIDSGLKGLAEAMAALSATPLPDDLEPLFP